MPIHAFNSEVESLAKEILAYSLLRLKDDPPLDGPRTAEDLFQEVGNTITAKGLGGHEALEVFTNVLAKACISTDHPRNLAFIPSAPTEYSNLFDLVVGASSLYGGSWQEGAGAVFAENQALRWIADLAGLPQSAGGVFVQGGTIGNLSALVVARAAARKKYPNTTRWAIASTPFLTMLDRAWANCRRSQISIGDGDGAVIEKRIPGFATSCRNMASRARSTIGSSANSGFGIRAKEENSSTIRRRSPT